jgi:hypothetical protein
MIEAFIPKRAHIKKISILSCWYHWIELYVVYEVIKTEPTKAPYVTEKRV